MGEKWAIVASGGGLTCSYSVGSILALVDKYGFTTPDIVIASSGGAGTMAYYVAGQYRSIRNIWENLLCSSKFLTPWRFWRVMDIDYLIDKVFKQQDPLDTEKIYNSNIHFLISLTNAITGKVEFFSNKDRKDVFEVLRATKAMPLAYGKIIRIGDSGYCDTYASSNVNTGILKAKQLGADKIIVLENSSANPLTSRGLNLWIKTRSREFQKNYERELGKMNTTNPDRNILFLSPRNKLNISTLCNDKKLLKQSIDQGYKDTLKNSELETFLQKQSLLRSDPAVSVQPVEKYALPQFP